MGRVAPPSLGEIAVSGPIIAHLRGGPFNGSEQVLYRAQEHKSWRVRRGFVRRQLGGGPRHAWYELARAWRDDGIDHGEYRYLGTRSEAAPRDTSTSEAAPRDTRAA